RRRDPDVHRVRGGGVGAGRRGGSSVPPRRHRTRSGEQRRVLARDGVDGDHGDTGAAHGPRVASGRATCRATPRHSTGPGHRAPPGDSRSCRRSRDVIVQPYAARAGRVRAPNLRAGARAAGTSSCSRTLRGPVAVAREICVPVRALRELPDDEFRALLAHEAAHVVRRDAAWLMIAAAVRALGWWQPLNLVAAARLRLAMELCCDERAAAEPHERAALARCLITVAEWSVADGPGFAAMAMSE